MYVSMFLLLTSNRSSIPAQMEVGGAPGHYHDGGDDDDQMEIVMVMMISWLWW